MELRRLEEETEHSRAVLRWETPRDWRSLLSPAVVARESGRSARGLSLETGASRLMAERIYAGVDARCADETPRSAFAAGSGRTRAKPARKPARQFPSAPDLSLRTLVLRCLGRDRRRAPTRARCSTA